MSGTVVIEGYEKRKLNFPDRNSLFDYNFAAKRNSQPGSGFEWVTWTDYIDLNEKIPKSTIPQ